ncbi:universal stress protein [Pontibacter sp. 13R65]|uniref:universal stress protein n=1 Tax=Pontibacter sp. 13R65 TaxID=3127458 RepID=UPI00301D413F
MKNILFSTDLSKHACNIALYAAYLCRYIGARLIIFHAYEPTGQHAQSPQHVHMERAVQSKMDNLTWKLKKVPSLSITRLLKPHLSEDETLYIAQKIKADLVIMSADNARPAASNATLTLLTNAQLPTLLVPPKAAFNPFSRIAIFEETGEQPVNCIGINFLRHLSDSTRHLELIRHLQAHQHNVYAAANKEVNTAQPLHANSSTPSYSIINGAQENLALIITVCQPELIVLPAPMADTAPAMASRIKSVQNKFIPILLVPPVEAQVALA